jgi:hypothetical protein
MSSISFSLAGLVFIALLSGCATPATNANEDKTSQLERCEVLGSNIPKRNKGQCPDNTVDKRVIQDAVQRNEAVKEQAGR